MKKIITLIAVAALCACGGKDAPYKNALPKDAAVVVAVNPAQLAAKFNIKDFKETNLGKQMLNELDVTSEQKDMVMSLLQDPSQGGVSMGDKVYIFATSDKTAGLVAGVEDRAKVDETLTKAGFTKTEVGGRTFLEKKDHATVMAYDDNVLICYIGNDASDNVQSIVEGLFTQKEGFLSTHKEVAAALEGSADICSVVAYDKVMDFAKALNPMAAMAYSQMKGFDEMYKGLYAGITANFEKGEVVVDASAIYTDKAVQKKMEEMAAKMTGKINGGVLKYIPEDAVLAFAANIKGAGLYDFLAEQEELKERFSAVPVVKDVMSAIDGDVAFALTTVKGKGIPEGAIFVELSKPDAITAYASMAATAGAKAVEGKEFQFVMEQGGIKVQFGVQDKMFYATNDARIVAALGGEKIASLAGNSLFKGAGAGFVNFEPLRSVLAGSHSEAKFMLDAIARLDVTQPSRDTNRFVLKMTDTSTNAAEVLFGLVDMAVGGNAEVVEPEVEEVEIVEEAA